MSNFKPFKEIVCNSIRLLRLKTGKNQEEFSEFCGVSYDSLRKWETFKNVPNAENLDKICKANNINIINLLLLSSKTDKSKIVEDIINKLHLLEM